MDRKRSTRVKLLLYGGVLVGCVLAAIMLRSCADYENKTSLQEPSYNHTEEISGTYTEEVAPSDSQAPSDPTSEIQSDWRLLLVNPWQELPEDFIVDLKQLNNGHAVDERIYPDLQAMMDAARAAGLSPTICSSYRTQENQQALYSNKIKRLMAEGYTQQAAKVEAGRWVALPGTSEHQTGLALDIVASSYQVLNEEQENTEEQIWLMENAYRYGFILRYPKEKTHITGIGYEPWHYRYVGKQAAKEIYEQGVCLEEYLQSIMPGGTGQVDDSTVLRNREP